MSLAVHVLIWTAFVRYGTDDGIGTSPRIAASPVVIPRLGDMPRVTHVEAEANTGRELTHAH